MTVDALTETVLDEAEAVVRAEWIRLQHDLEHDEALREHACCPVGLETPAARPRLFGVVTLTAMHRQNGTTSPRRRGGWPPRCEPLGPRPEGRGRRIWPTHRSPPQAGGDLPSKPSSNGGDALKMHTNGQ
jgi:hypothetical protein